MSGNRWADIETRLVALGAEITEAEGSRLCVRLFNDRRVFHRPHPSPDTDKGAVTNIRRFLQSYRRPLASIPARLRP